MGDGESDGNFREYPSFFQWPSAIPHYYGNHVRHLFVAAAALSVLALPTLGDLLPFGPLFQIGSALVLVLLAGLTNPHGKWILWYDMAVAGVGVFLLEEAAIYFYPYQSEVLFAARETIALILLFAFYFSVKTVRAMSLRQVGHPSRLGEFDEEEIVEK